MRFLKFSFAAVLLMTLLEGLHCIPQNHHGLNNAALENKLEKLDNTLRSLEVDLEKKLDEDEDTPQNDENQMSDDANSLSCNFEDSSTNCGLVFEPEVHTNNNKPKWEYRRDYSFIRDASASRGGYFYFADVKDNHQKNQFTTLSAPLTISGNNACLQFSYLMYDHFRYCDAGRFKVELVCGDERTELFRATHAPSYKWYKQYADISKAAGTKCKLEFRVSKGLGKQSRGGIAVDDVSITFGSKCSPPAAFDPTAVQKPSAMSCEFENFQDDCFWKPRGAIKWSHANWGTRQGGTGPDNYFGRELYSTSGGAYRYVDSRKSNDFDYRNKSAIFESPVLKAEGLQNMKFAYSMYGKDISSLKVVFVDQSSGVEKVAFEKKGNQGKGPAYSWFDACVQLPATGTYKIKIEAAVGNGYQSDIAVDNILIGDGNCEASKAISSCSYGDDEKCPFVTDETCGATSAAGFTKTEEFKVKRKNLIGEISRIAKEWSLELKIKPGSGKRDGWSSIIKFTETERACCWRGDRVPGFQFHPKSHKLEIANAVGWNGNWGDSSIILPEGKFSTIKLRQYLKAADGKYYYEIYLNGARKREQRNDIPREHRNVKIFASADLLEPADATLKDIVFKNEGAFEECSNDCNKKLSDKSFDGFFNPKEVIIHQNAAEMSPTKGNLVKEGFTVQKQYELSMKVKVLGKVRGWTNIVHVTKGENCCDKGTRVPAIFIYSDQFKMHMTSAVQWSGNHAYNDGLLVQDKFVEVIVRQKKETDGRYYYKIIIDGKEKHSKINFYPSTFKDMKLYIGSPHYNAANVKIKDFVFKNLVSQDYQCPNMCKGLPGQEAVEGAVVKTMTYTHETCNDREFQVALPTEGPFLRYGCLHLSYKASSLAWYGNLKCELFVQANRHYLERIKIEGDKALNVWNTKSISVNRYSPRLNSPIVGVRAYIRNHCPSLTFGEIRLEEGLCPDKE